MEKQSNFLNEVKLIEAKQELNEPIRTFLARLRGLATIWDLTTPCPSLLCTEVVSHANRSILTALVKGLVDNETKGEIMSKVERLTLDKTVTFVEARETGKRSLAGHG